MTRDQIRETVRRAMSNHGCHLDIAEIGDDTAMAQDAKIDGIDVDDFVSELEDTFGKFVWAIPWGLYSDQRASFRGCGVLLAPVWLVWRFVTWPIGGIFLPPPDASSVPRLTLLHLVDVLERGEWFEP